MMYKRLAKEEREEIIDRYFHTKVGQKQLSQEFGVSIRAIAEVISKYRKQKQKEKENGVD